jgi:hypothetical protein
MGKQTEKLCKAYKDAAALWERQLYVVETTQARLVETAKKIIANGKDIDDDAINKLIALMDLELKDQATLKAQEKKADDLDQAMRKARHAMDDFINKKAAMNKGEKLFHSVKSKYKSLFAK